MMIRLLIIVLIVLVGAAALTTLNPAADKSLNPIMKGLASVRAWFSESATTVESTVKDPLTSMDKNATKVYKWQDAAGEWHFSNQPPPAGIKGSVETYRSDVNVTQAPPVVEVIPEPEVEAESKGKAEAIPDSAAPLMPITDPEKVKQLIEDAKNVQGLVDNRQKNIDQHLPQ